ncbi:GGDEF domain-containing protein [Enterovirga rhinocerotis]|uniref:GGDEF domain-containing protein n=1 Tax=Enterovirga rhinocerotis TaxID=1339210 RepID=UPI003CCB0036
MRFLSPYVLKWATIVTLFCAALSISTSTAVRYYLGVKSDGITIIVRLILPFIIAFPIAVVLFSKIERLDLAYRSLLKKTRELSRRASTDPLTGLLNRRSFEEQFDAAIKLRSGGKFIIADVDYLKSINDRHGHLAGDNAILAVSHALEIVLGDECLIARIGGDEFCAYVPRGEARTVDRLVVAINRAATDNFRERSGLPHVLSVSVGVQRCQSGVTFQEMMSSADSELYRKKRSRSPVAPARGAPQVSEADI